MRWEKVRKQNWISIPDAESRVWNGWCSYWKPLVFLTDWKSGADWRVLWSDSWNKLTLKKLKVRSLRRQPTMTRSHASRRPNASLFLFSLHFHVFPLLLSLQTQLLSYTKHVPTTASLPFTHVLSSQFKSMASAQNEPKQGRHPAPGMYSHLLLLSSTTNQGQERILTGIRTGIQARTPFWPQTSLYSFFQLLTKTNHFVKLHSLMMGKSQ